jgi:hypothetical protein
MTKKDGVLIYVGQKRIWGIGDELVIESDSSGIDGFHCCFG